MEKNSTNTVIARSSSLDNYQGAGRRSNKANFNRLLPLVNGFLRHGAFGATPRNDGFGILLSILCSFLLFSCLKKNDPKPEHPQQPNESEVITTLKLIVTEQVSGTVSTFKFVDIDGPGGEVPSKDKIVLDANKTYHVRLILLDQTKFPTDTVSNEIYEERDDHQFFFTVSNANLSSAYTDSDTHGVPVGLHSDFTTGSASTGKLKIVLKHQPGLKPTSGMGDSSLGETDVEVVFNVAIN